MILKAWDEKKQKHVVAGRYNIASKCFVRKVKPNHYMGVEKGYGLQETLIGELQNFGCETVRLETSTAVYESAFSGWNAIPKDYGHGLQRFKAVATMRKVK